MTFFDYKSDVFIAFIFCGLLLSDFNKEISRAYDAIYEQWILDMKGVSKRSAFVIDREGMIRYAEVLESPADLPNFDAVNTILAQIA